MKFGYVYHPRFGHIRSNVAIKDIKKDEELFVNYGYGTHSPNVPQWYIETYEMEMGEPYPQKTAQNRQRSSCGSKS